jgi:two-component system sensor histidine kinase and response regulator WspE
VTDHEMSAEDFLGDLSLMDLFGAEIESLTGVLTEGVLALERDPSSLDGIEELMRAAHSAKGAARIAQLDPIVTLAHTMEDYFVAVQSEKLRPTADHTDILLAAIDVMAQLAKVSHDQFQEWISEREPEIDERVAEIGNLLRGDSAPMVKPVVVERADSPTPPRESTAPASSTPEPTQKETGESRDRVVRLTSENLDRLMSLAGEVRIDTSWLRPFSDSLLQLKSGQTSLANVLEGLRNNIDPGGDLAGLNEAVDQLNDNRQMLTERLDALETFARRSSDLSSRLYRKVIDSRMRPFSDGTQAFPRMLRDLARTLGKKIRFDLVGADTEVDRDILEKLEAPLTHLIRNALDHSMELPAERLAAGKPEEGTIRLAARHAGGMLSIEVADDGKGIDLARIRDKVVELELADAEIASRLTESELLEFLFLPSFSTAREVTETSGRGVGMDVVQNMVQAVGGVIHTSTVSGAGTTFHMQLPLTLSVNRTLMVEISGEAYAFSIARVDRALVLENVADRARRRQAVLHR